GGGGIGGGGDLRTERAVPGRFFLAELDSQTALLRIVATETRRRPDLLTEAVEQLITSTFRGFAEWLREAAGQELDQDRASTIAALALRSPLSSRLLSNV